MEACDHVAAVKSEAPAPGHSLCLVLGSVHSTGSHSKALAFPGSYSASGILSLSSQYPNKGWVFSPSLFSWLAPIPLVCLPYQVTSGSLGRTDSALKQVQSAISWRLLFYFSARLFLCLPGTNTSVCWMPSGAEMISQYRIEYVSPTPVQSIPSCSPFSLRTNIAGR